jgi:phosphatidate cytidylyltransferase
MPELNLYLIWMIVGTFVALLLGTGVRLYATRNSPPEVVQQRLGSLKVWWILATLWSAAALSGLAGAAILLGIASLLGMREFLRLLGPVEAIGRPVIFVLIVCGVGHYGLIVAGEQDFAFWLFPIVFLLSLGAVRVLCSKSHLGSRRRKTSDASPEASQISTIQHPQSTTEMTAEIFWGGMLLIYSLSFSLRLFQIESPPESVTEPLVGTAGPFLFLVLLTEMNDIMQALVGRKFGKRKIAPQVSPNKTLEGLIGGLLTLIGLSFLLAPWMTTWTVGRSPLVGLVLSISAGVLISLVGFVGDIHMSAIKRDAGVKDGSALLPGMGGVIDRVDSLIFTGPAFYIFVEMT